MGLDIPPPSTSALTIGGRTRFVGHSIAPAAQTMRAYGLALLAIARGIPRLIERRLVEAAACGGGL